MPVHAGPGGVGSFAIQLARLAGTRGIATAIGRSSATNIILLAKSGRNRSVGIGMDVSVERDVIEGVRHLLAVFGTIDILIHNAGIQIVRPLENFTFAEWKHVLAVQVDGAFLTTKACLPQMKRSALGGIIIY